MYMQQRITTKLFISRVSLTEALNIIYISTDAADLLDHLPGNTNGTCCPKDAYKALGSSVSHNIMYLSLIVCLSACLSGSISLCMCLLVSTFLRILIKPASSKGAAAWESTTEFVLPSL